MQLRDFIQQTICEIAEGIQRAKISTSDIWAIAPGALNGERLLERSEIEFDVAVTVVETSTEEKGREKGGAAKIEVMGFSIGGDLSGGRKSSEVSERTVASRIAFKVPVYMNAHFRGDSNIAEEAAYFETRKQSSV